MKPLVRRALLWTIILGAVSFLSSGAFGDEKTVAEPSFIDLSTVANRNLAEDQHGFEGNNLSELKSGVRTFEGVSFKISDKFLSLGSRVEKRFPTKIEDIKIDQAAKRIYFLHATGYGSYGEPGAVTFVADDTKIGEYVIHFADDTTVSVPIVYGQDVRDWWNWDKPFGVTRGKIAWSGMNLFSRQQGQKIYLYLATWENPKPDVKVSSIDYVSTATTAAAPFCIAITAESK
jgi:hypothetical protein